MDSIGNKIIIFFFLSLLSYKCIAQVNKVYLTKENQKKIEKNILIGRILEHLNKEDSYSQKANDFLPDKNWKLDLEYRLAEEINFPNKDYIIYQINNSNYDVINKKEKTISTKVSSHQYINPLDKTFLIGINKTNPYYIHFISGTFLKSKISYEFKLDINSPKMFISFLELKLFNYKAKDIKYKKKKRKYLLFEGYSESLSSKVKIKVNVSDFDKILVEVF